MSQFNDGRCNGDKPMCDHVTSTWHLPVTVIASLCKFNLLFARMCRSFGFFRVFHRKTCLFFWNTDYLKTALFVDSLLCNKVSIAAQKMIGFKGRYASSSSKMFDWLLVCTTTCIMFYRKCVNRFHRLVLKASEAVQVCVQIVHVFENKWTISMPL